MSSLPVSPARGPDAIPGRVGIPWQVLAIAAIGVVVLLVLSPAYGWHRDELYFVVAGRHPALGYVDQPPLTPLLSAASVALFGVSPTAVRILPAIAYGAVVVVTALTARDLGGSRRAIILAALVVAFSGVLAVGHLDSTTSYDIAAWAVVLWLVIQLLDAGDRRAWLLVGLAAGVALENKHIMLFLGAGLAAGLLLARRWDIVRSPWAWGALGLAVLLWLPNLAWQVANGFPQLEMAAAIADESPGPAKLAVELVFVAGFLLFPVTLAGGWWLLRAPAARPWRAVGWASIVVLVLVIVVGGRSYYAAGVIPTLIAAGSIPLDGWLSRGRAALRTGVFGVAAVVSGLVTAVLVLPIVPLSQLADTPIPDIYGEAVEQVGWPELVAAVERAVGTLSPAEHERTVILTNNYGEAGALEVLGHDLPAVYSGHNGYWDWGPPSDDATVGVLVGGAGGVRIDRIFHECTIAATVDNGVGVANEEQGARIYVCRSPARAWSDVWPELRHLD